MCCSGGDGVALSQRSMLQYAPRFVWFCLFGVSDMPACVDDDCEDESV